MQSETVYRDPEDSTPSPQRGLVAHGFESSIALRVRRILKETPGNGGGGGCGSDPQRASFRLLLTATSRMPWGMDTSPANVTATRPSISCRGTEYLFVSISTAQSLPTT